MKRISLLALLLVFLAASVLAETYTIGSGTSATSTNPYYGSYNFGWCKTIYTATELHTAGLTDAADIIGIGFYIGNTPVNYAMEDQYVFLRHTTVTQYETTDTGYPGNTNFEQVFHGDVVYNGSGWIHFVFSSPYSWDGTQNLEFLYENLDMDNPTGYPTFRYTSTSTAYQVVYKGSDTAFPGADAGTRTYSRANIQIITPSSTSPSPASPVYPGNGAAQISPATLLSWIPGPNWPTGYKLSLGTDNPPSNLVQNQDQGNATSYNPTPDLELNTTYYWQITPYNAFGDAADCPVWSFSTHGTNTINTLPYFQQFDAVTAPSLPFDWTSIIQSTATAATVVGYTTSPYSAPNCIRLFNSSDTGANLLLVGPQIEPNLNLNQIRIRFWGKGGTNYHLQVGVISNPTDPSTFVGLHDLTVVANWNEYLVNLTNYTGNGRYIAFKHGCASTSQSLYIDDVHFEQISPNDLACTAVSGNPTPSVNSASVYTARIYNWGTAAQTNYTVKLFNLNNVELATATGISIAPDAEVFIPLTWTPTVQEATSLYAKVFLPGDVNPANDQSPLYGVYVQPAGVVMVTVGEGNLNEGVPLEFYYKSSLHQSIYYQSELNVYGIITALTFYNNFQTNLPDKPCKFWLGQTSLNDLSGGWILTGLTQVFDGTISFPSGENTITIPLQTPFTYTSGNLVLYANRPMDTQFFNTNDNFKAQTVGTNRARKLYSDSTVYDPLAPSAAGTLSGTFPRASFSFVTQGLAQLNGTVNSGGNPIPEVNVVINGTSYATQTNAAGAYIFPYVIPGTFTVTASKLGFESQTLTVELIAGQTHTLNFNLTASTSVNVYGTVTGSDAPTTGLEGATIVLSGIQNHTATSSATGTFSIPGVLSGNSYSYTVSKLGYQDLSGNINVGAIDYNMGTLVLSELALPPGPVTATENIEQTEVSLVWSAPGAGGPGQDFEQNDGGWIPSSNWTNPLGDFQWTNTYNAANYVVGGYPTSEFPPPTAHSGTGLWGTVLYGPYSNAGGFSYLTKELSFAGISNPQMRFWSWNNSFGNWDYGQVAVNGNVVWGPAWDTNPVEWEEVIIDLSAYANMANVTVQFQHYTTTVVNYAGWYIDDVYLGPAQAVAFSKPQSWSNPYPGLSELQAAKIAEEQAMANPSASQNRREPERIAAYKVWRLLALDQDNETLWTLLTLNAIPDTSFIDVAWGPLPSGVYLYAVKAVYANNVLSTPVFSNELHKGMMGVLSGTVTEFGTSAPIAGATITAGEYSGTSDAQGNYSFLVYAGNYTVVCSKTGYQTSTQPGIIIVGTETTTLNFVLTEVTLPPAAVQAVEAMPNVNLSWMAPGTAGGTWLHYDSGENHDSIGTNAAADFDVAIRFPATALQDYAGMSLYTVKAWPAQAGSFSIRVWTGGSASAPASMVVDQPFTPVLDSYNAVTLSSPVTINTNEELWFGYRCNVTGGYPAGCDAGPAIDGLGNMMYYQGAWSTLLALAPTLNYNWNIQGYVGYSAPTTAPQISYIPAILSTGSVEMRCSEGILTRSGKAKSQVTAAPATQQRVTGYKVWRLQSEQGNNENLWSSLTPNPITATSFVDTAWSTLPYDSYKWAVKAIYVGGAMSPPAFSNVLAYIPTVGTIAGIVRNLQNQPIPGATITCGTVNATTNNSGAYSMQVNAGVHSVTASHPNYLPLTHDNVTVVTGQTTTVNFQMSPSANDDPNNSPVLATELMGNFPNPFNPATTISFSVKQAGVVKLLIYNLQGQLVKELLNEHKDTGHYQANWSGTDYNGQPVASGVYYYKMITGKYSSTRKMVLLK